ncbi:nitroreductase family protein [Gordonia amicalis]
MAHGAAAAYFAHFESSGLDEPEWAEAVRRELLPAVVDSGYGGTKPRTVKECFDVDAFDTFVESRESIRHFSDDPVPLVEIEAAARVAATSPSVCNRQGSRVRAFERGAAADALLRHQRGNTGFGSDASHILLVTHDLGTMVTPAERNQGYVDGGLYAMTLVYALHARRIGTCCLNWSATPTQDRGLRREIGLPDNEVVIMMMAVGYPDPAAAVSISSTRGGRFSVGMG